MKDVRVTHIGGPTVLIEVDGWRLLTDPTFDPAGRKYRLRAGHGISKSWPDLRSLPATSDGSTQSC